MFQYLVIASCQWQGAVSLKKKRNLTSHFKFEYCPKIHVLYLEKTMDNIFVSTSNVSTLHNKPLFFHKQVGWQADVRALMGPICTNRNCSSTQKNMLIPYFKHIGLDDWEKSPLLWKNSLLLADWMHCTALRCHDWLISVAPFTLFFPWLISVAPFNCLTG